MCIHWKMLLCPCFLFLALLASLFYFIPLIYYYIFYLFFPQRSHALSFSVGSTRHVLSESPYRSLGCVLRVSCSTLSSASGFLSSLPCAFGLPIYLPLVLQKAHGCPIVYLQKVCVCMHAFVNFVSTLFLDLVRAHPVGMPSGFRVFPTWGEAHSLCRLLKAPWALLWCVSQIYFSVFNVIVRKDFLTSRLCKCSSIYGSILITFFQMASQLFQYHF